MEEPSKLSKDSSRKRSIPLKNSSSNMRSTSIKPLYTYSAEKLSPAAIYANRRKYGIYETPGHPTVGVSAKASGKY